MAKENKQMTCAPNYEAYYEEYRDKYNCIEEKLKEEHKRNMILEAQMEVVRLIFGGNRYVGDYAYCPNCGAKTDEVSE